MRKIKPLNKKGQIGTLVPGIVGLVIAIIILVMGLIIIQEIRDTDIVDTVLPGCNATDRDGCDAAWQATNTSLGGLGDFSDFVPIIVIALAASVIIGLILVGFAFRRQR